MSSPRTPLFYALALVALVAGLTVLPIGPGPSGGATSATAPQLDTSRGSADTITPDSPRDPDVDRPGGDREPVRGDFLYLFDVSTSTHTGAANSPYLRAVNILRPGINAIRENEVLMPQRHRVGTIGKASLMQDPLCDFRAEPGTIFTKTDTMVVARRLLGCVAAMRAVAPEGGTDIRGALHYAGLTLGGTESRTRGVVLVTDLEEVLRRGQIPATPKLTGVCVLILSMMTPWFAENPDSLTRLQEGWSQRIREWGAVRVEARSVLGFQPTEFASYFETCGNR